MVEQQQAVSRQSSGGRVRVYHTVLWAKYKGAVYSALYRLSVSAGLDLSFVQIAETDTGRTALGGVDLSYHQYPYRLVLRGSYSKASTIRKIVLLALDLIRNPSDLVVLSGYDRIENWAMLALCMLLGRRRAVTCDSTIYDRPQIRWKSWAKRLFFAQCDGFIGYGQRSKEYLMSLGAREANIFVPCQAAALPHDYDASAVLSQYRGQGAASRQPPAFLYVGRLAPEKGLGDLLEAFSLLRSTLPDARLDIIGAGVLEQRLLEQREGLALTQVVTLHGARALDDIVPLFYRSMALVLPSHSEPWGLVVNEALSFGCPVVVSDRCGCVPELVIDGVTGYAFQAGDVGALSAAMLSVCRLSQDRLTTAAACLRVIAAYSPERAALRMLQGCTQFLQGRY